MPRTLTPTHLTAGVEGFTTQEDQEMLSRIEKQLKRRFAIGSQVSEHSIIQDFTKQVGFHWGWVGTGRVAGSLACGTGNVPWPSPTPSISVLLLGR